jgi:hypothetical protein
MLYRSSWRGLPLGTIAGPVAEAAVRRACHELRRNLAGGMRSGRAGGDGVGGESSSTRTALLAHHRGARTLAPHVLVGIGYERWHRLFGRDRRAVWIPHTGGGLRRRSPGKTIAPGCRSITSAARITSETSGETSGFGHSPREGGDGDADTRAVRIKFWEATLDLVQQPSQVRGGRSYSSAGRLRLQRRHHRPPASGDGSISLPGGRPRRHERDDRG